MQEQLGFGLMGEDCEGSINGSLFKFDGQLGVCKNQP